MAVRFYETLSTEAADKVHQLTRLSFELKDNLAKLLSPYGFNASLPLKQQIIAGQISAHPAWEHYLSAAIIEQSLSSIRDALKHYLLALNSATQTPNSPTPPYERANAWNLLHSFLEPLVDQFGEHMREDVAVYQDALAVRFFDGTDVLLRYSDTHDFSFEWQTNNSVHYLDNIPTSEDVYFTRNGKRQAIKGFPNKNLAWESIEAALNMILRQEYPSP